MVMVIYNINDEDIDGDGVYEDIDGDGIYNINDEDIDGDNLLNANDNDIDGDNVLNKMIKILMVIYNASQIVMMMTFIPLVT